MQFAKIVGQRNLINTLIDVVLNNRVSHAQLFLGNAGYGGFALALAYAQFVSCTDKQVFASSNKDGLKADSCGKCPSCLKYEKLSHPDLFFTFPNTTTKAVDKNNESASFLDTFRNYVFSKNAYIDLESWYQELGVENKQGAINVRDANTIIKNLTLKTYESQYKINIVWGVDKLQIDAANKLLKILNEEHDIQFQIFESMQSKGWYETATAPQAKVDRAVQTHITSATNLKKPAEKWHQHTVGRSGCKA